MTLAPDPGELEARARADLRIGLPVVLHAAGGDWLVLAAETLSAGRLAALPATDRVVAVTARRAETLKARAYDGDLARIVVPPGADARWIAAVADPAADLAAPMKGPFVTLRDGDAGPHRAALRLVKAARLLPAALVVPAGGSTPGLTRLDLADLTADPPIALAEAASARVPTRFAAAGQVRVFRPADGGGEHYAVEIGRPLPADGSVLVRLHSACFTGDVLGSLKCDCGAQLHGALARMAEAGGGVLLYLDQEGRGIGLANKLRAYDLQDQGFDTVEANHRLGFEDDERDFRIGATMLRAMGIAEVRLLTNNPAKVAMLERCGVTVSERVPLTVGRTADNAGYLDVKARKSGHIL